MRIGFQNNWKILRRMPRHVKSIRTNSDPITFVKNCVCFFPLTVPYHLYLSRDQVHMHLNLETIFEGWDLILGLRLLATYRRIEAILQRLSLLALPVCWRWEFSGGG